MISYKDELYHHGIKGQKWGVRRYQNEDGSLTSAGERRYNIENSKAALKEARKNAKATAREYYDKGLTFYGAERPGGEKLRKKAEKANLELLDAKANYASSKKKTAEKAAKAEFKTYRDYMKKNYNYNVDGKQIKQIYKHIAAKKGKEYADRVERSAHNRSVAQFATGTAIVLGTSLVAGYMQTKYG